MFFEHKLLYRSMKDTIPDDYYTIPIGKARLVREGNTMGIITYGLGVKWAEEVLAAMPQVDGAILDLRTLLPWDCEAVADLVKKTGRIMVVHEDTLTGGIGAEIAAWITENCFQYLDAPVMRVASLDTPVPFAPTLEQAFLGKSRLKAKVEQLINY